MSKERTVSTNPIVEIRRRHAAVTERSREINERYSSLLSALILPYILQAALFSQNSPFFKFFLDYFAQYAPQMLPQMQEGIEALGKIAKMREELDSTLQNLPQPGRFAHLIKSDASKADTQNAIFQAAAEVCQQQGCRTPADQHKVIQSVTVELLQEAQLNAMRALKNVKIKGLDVMSQNAPRYLAEMEFSNVMNIPKVFGVILGKWLIMDPLLQRVWRNDVQPLPRFLELQSQTELDAIKKQLTETEKAQKNPAERAARISMSILPLLVVLYFLQSIYEFRVPQSVWLMCFSLAASGITQTSYEIKRRYDERDYAKKLNANTQTCQKLFNQNNIAKTVSPHNLRSLKQSRIMVTFNVFENLTAAQVCRTVVQVLKNNRIIILDAVGDSLWLRGATTLSDDKITAIQAELKTALTQKKERSVQKDKKPLDETVWSPPLELEPKPIISRAKPQKSAAPESTVASKTAVTEKTDAAKKEATAWKTVPTSSKTSSIINAHGKNRFTFFNVQLEDFGGNKACFKKFKGLVTEDPTVVPLRKFQGLVHSKKFGGTLKAKALGEFGNVRLYASKKEVAPSGETLYVFDKVVLKAH